MQIQYSDQQADVQTEAYMETDGDQVSVYSGTSDESGEMAWIRTDTGWGSEELGRFDGRLTQALADGEITADLVQDADEKVDGRDCYLVETTIPASLAQEALGEVFQSAAEESNLFDGIPEDAWADTTADVQFLFYRENGLPAKVTVNLSGLGDAMLSAMLGVDGTSDAEELGISFRLNEYTLSVAYYGYNSVTEIVIPDEVRETAYAITETEEDTEPI